jgi:predicted transposase/invertase (TIGR01784 family)
MEAKMKKRKCYDHLNDFLFYKIMGEKGDEVQLLGFLNAVLGKTGEDRFAAVKIIENKFLSPKVIGDKGSILDVRAVLQGKTRVNIEVQVRNQHNMARRSLFYWSKEYTESLGRGQDYRKLPDVIAINIVNFDFPPVRNCHTRFHLREDLDRDLTLTDALEIHFLNMVQYRKQAGKKLLNDPLNRWMAWLNTKSPPDLIAEVLKMDRSIKAAEKKLDLVTRDKDFLRYYNLRLMALSDQTSEISYAREEGRAEGILEIARNALVKGLPINVIHDITGLDIKTLEQIAKSN